MKTRYEIQEYYSTPCNGLGLFILGEIIDPILKMMIIIRTNPETPDFRALVKHLDTDLANRDGEEHIFYHQFNNPAQLKQVVILYGNGVPLGCGAFKEFAPTTVEIKRMFTFPEHRRKGIASTILMELETWALEMSYEKCLLETGKRQPEAIALYQKNGYLIIPNYGPYVGVGNSVCFEKTLIAKP